MSQFPFTGNAPVVSNPIANMAHPAPSRTERRVDPADGKEYYFDEVRARLEARGSDPVAYWFDRMGVVQPTNIIRTEYPEYGAIGPGKMSTAKPAFGNFFIFSPRNVFTSVGVVLLLLLCIVPLWNSFALMQNANYIFWAGRSVPTWIIIICIIMVFLYVATSAVFFSAAHPAVQSEQTVMMIANIFITLFGLILMMMALPLINQSNSTYYNLMNACDYSEETHRLFEYSQVLQNIRATPDCATKPSVEDCLGYEPAPPYTVFLKEMESSFRCSGFCYKPPAAALTSSNSTTVEKTSLIEQRIDGTASVASPKGYPPTLFSLANFQATCEGMAARDMKNFAGDIGTQTFYQGIYLVLIAVTTGFLKLVGFCVRKA
mmetsp:Transcript_129762/g.225499  ORF Transcript_129762/g.225499 Transcript_129762/m.225499 type:complete len:375 (-) Transcript_129762:91-1215(-)